MISMNSGWACLAAVVAVTAITFTSAHAALINQGSTTRDTDTNLEWLDLTETAGLSYNDVIGGSGGHIAAGFRYATTAEVGVLFTNAGIGNIVGNNFPADLEEAEALVGLLGPTTTNSSRGLSEFVAGEALFTDPITAVSLSIVSFSPGSTGFADASGSGIDLDVRNAETGSFLVRAASTSSVPEPGTLALFGGGFLLLGAAARRKARFGRHQSV